jgi:hypothetical protein
MADGMANYKTLVTATTPDIIAGLAAAGHHFKTF